MKIFPAIDIIGGKVVRLYKGDYGKKTEYGDSVLAQAEKFLSLGAKYIHLVDLDGAKSGKTDNIESVKAVCKTGLFVEIGGGIRNMATVEKYREIGVNRVILGTSALKDPEFLLQAVKEHGDFIAVGVDAKDGLVAVNGWQTVDDKTNSIEFCKKMRDIGVKNVIYTDISKDGTLSGTNIEVYKELSKIKGLDITASGGITFIDEIKTLKDLGLYGAILGKALYEGKLDLVKAISVANGSENVN